MSALVVQVDSANYNKLYAVEVDPGGQSLESIRVGPQREPAMGPSGAPDLAGAAHDMRAEIMVARRGGIVRQVVRSLLRPFSLDRLRPGAVGWRLRRAGLFDADFYIQRYADAPASPRKAATHYVRHGALEGRRPNPIFDSRYYLESNPDVAEGNSNPLLHYLLCGAGEGRDPSRDFSTTWYVATNPDVRALGVNPLAHYLSTGVARGLATRPPSLRLSAKSAEPVDVIRPIASDWDAITWAPSRQPVVDVVVPVFAGEEVTLRCLFSVLSSSNVTPYRLLVINDASPEPDLSVAIRSLAFRFGFDLIEHIANMGFVSSANEGMGADSSRDVLLLNSDAEVYGDWLDRLRTAALSDADIGTVTPFTNNGTICSYPRIAVDNRDRLELRDADLDGLFSTVNRGGLVDIPTAVGFCMYIRRACIERTGSFDEEAFGRGYGEENDFCLRAEAGGWRHVLAADVFVRHHGEASFGSESPERIRLALKVLNERHQGYDKRIRDFIKRDPIQTFRRTVDVARLQRLRAGRPSMVLLSHRIGGGTEQHVQDLARALDNDGVQSIIIRPAANSRVGIDCFGAGDLANLGFPAPNGRPDAALTELLADVGVMHMHVHHLQQFGKEMSSWVTATGMKLNVGYDVTIHDYLMVCPRINLVHANGKYCGVAPVAVCQDCVASGSSPFGAPDVDLWRTTHADFLNCARRVFVPSADAQRRLRSWLPDRAFTVRNHPEPAAEPKVRNIRARSSREPVRVALIGALSEVKGSDVLQACARDAAYRALPLTFVVVGFTDRDQILYELPNVVTTGRFDGQEDARELLRKHECEIAWFPAIWPETFCYALSIALDEGLFPVSFDLGAPADRIREQDWGAVIPYELVDQPAIINEFFLDCSWPERSIGPRTLAMYPSILGDYYGLPHPTDALQRSQLEAGRSGATVAHLEDQLGEAAQ